MGRLSGGSRVRQPSAFFGTTMLDFIGIGAQKCGTTWLFQQLSQHPHVRFPAGKEVHFWDQQRHHGVDWWLGLFPDAPVGVMQGEITPAYGMLDTDTIQAIHERLPSVRLFYSIRNPIARAWSSALMALGRAELTIEEASDAWFIDHFRSTGSRRRGDYAATIARWRSVFSDLQLHVIVFDDIQTDPRGVLTRLADHLGIPADPFNHLDEASIRQAVFEGPGYDLRPSLRAVLQDLYADQIKALKQSMGRDLVHWLDWDGRR